MPATAAISFLAVASVWADLRVVIVVVEVRGFGEGARMGGERGLVVGGGDGEALGEEGAGRVLPGTKRERDTKVTTVEESHMYPATVSRSHTCTQLHCRGVTHVPSYNAGGSYTLSHSHAMSMNRFLSSRADFCFNSSDVKTAGGKVENMG